jgi:putative CRISPR-associated protein (TIGR02619 family)
MRSILQSGMPRDIISPVGLSVLNALKQQQCFLVDGQEARQLRHLVDRLGDKAGTLSAELSTLQALKANRQDKAVFLATDTDDSEQAARVNGLIAEHYFGVSTDSKRITSLGLEDAGIFKRNGIPSLVQALDSYVKAATDTRRQPLLSVGGGIKAVVPYIAVYGMLRGLPITYIFERTQDLLVLPPLPLEYDWGSLALAAQVFREIDQQTAVPRRHLEQLLGEDLPSLEGLFEEQDHNTVTLSAFGFMLLESLKRAQEHPVMLSPSAKGKYEALNGSEKNIIEAMLDRVRNPIIRAHKRHEIRGTDLDVYKPGNTRFRLAYWIEGETVYITEIYTSHDNYERILPGRFKRDYRREEFRPLWLAASQEEEEPFADEVITVALRDKERAEREKAEVVKDRDDALKVALEMERQVNQLRGDKELAEADRDAALSRVQSSAEEVERLRSRATELEDQQRQMASWSIGRRLRWALFGD